MKPTRKKYGIIPFSSGSISANSCRSACAILLVALTLLATALSARGGCNLQIVQAGPCLADGTFATPAEGDALYGVKIVFNVIGTPAAPFSIEFTMANITNDFNDINLSSGYGYWWYFDWTIPLDDPIPWSITLDPTGVSGNTNTDNTTNGVFTPIPPANTVVYYEPRIVAGSETAILNYTNLGVSEGGYIHFFEIFGEPGTHGAQSVLKVNIPTNGVSIATPPYGIPVLLVARTNAPTGNYEDTESFTAQLNNMLVNPTSLEAATWTDIAAMSTNWTEWLAPDTVCESTNPLITNFVFQTLGPNYQSTLNPYQAARLLHMAVMRTLAYASPSPAEDAVGALTNGMSDCGGFSALLVASLRCAGIPARRIAGFWLGDTWPNIPGDAQVHVRVEFHLPVAGVQWLVADPTTGNGSDPTGSYAYDFGYVPDANQFFAMDACDSHEMSFADLAAVQVPNDYYFYWDAGLNYSFASQYYLEPLAFLSVSNLSGSLFQFNLTNAPSLGSIVIESTTNLLTWSPVVTNAASATNASFSYSFPAATSPQGFFRASQMP